MNPAITIDVTMTGMSETDRAVQDLRNALASRGPMHARMAVRGKEYTQAHLRKLNRHRSASALGATPTGHHQKAAASIEADSDEQQGWIRIPRRTGLGRAFSDAVLVPGSGKKFLTIPAHASTYGRSVRDFPENTFKFVVLHSWRVFLVLMFASGSLKGEVGYFLKRQVTQKQDRKLLPSDAEYQSVARKAAIEYLTVITNGPQGGASSGMPSYQPT